MAPETEKSKMRKISILTGLSITLIASAAFATAPVDEADGYAPIPFPYIYGDYAVTDAEDADEASFDAALEDAEMTLLVFPECSGACHYHYTGSSPNEIHCVVPEQTVVLGDTSATGFAYYGAAPFDTEPNRVIMCKYTKEPSGDMGWMRVGYCDRGTVQKLTVDGMNAASTDARDVMAIIRHQANDDGVIGGPPIFGEDCNFGEFQNVFGTAAPTMTAIPSTEATAATRSTAWTAAISCGETPATTTCTATTTRPSTTTACTTGAGAASETTTAYATGRT
jgi:hypothetical protein